MPKQFLSINEAAARLGVSTKTLRRWEENGILSPKRTVGNQRRYSLADLDQANKQSLTINEAAQRLGLSAKTLRRWEEKGIITPQRTSGNQRRYAVSVIEVLKNQNPKAIVTTKIKKQAEKDLLNLEKERFFDIASVKPTPKIQNRPVAVDINPVVNDFPVITNDSEAISTHQAKIRHPEFISGSPTPTTEILKHPPAIHNKALRAGVQDDKLFRNDKFRKPLKYGFTFSSLFGIILVLALVSKITDPTILLSYIPYINGGKEVAVKNNEDVLQSATTRHDYAFKISIPVEMLSTASVSGNLTAPNILYSVLPGDNITISGDPQNPTISAVVEDIESLGLVAGNGISFDGTTITNTAPGTDVDVFANIKVGSTTITAGSNTDTFELVAGDNITLSTNTGSKKITIAADDQSSTGIEGIAILESGTTSAELADTLDFLGGDFDVGESPSGEANIQLAATLTSVTGVAGNFDVGDDLTVGGNINLSGGSGTLTLGSDTINDITGPGLTVSGSTLQVNLTTAGGSGSTSSNSGLEVGANGLTLLKGCSDGQLLKWDDTNTLWECDNDTGGGGSVDGTGAANHIAFWTDANSLSSNADFYWDNTNELLGLGTNGAPVAKLDVNGAAKGKALVILNETGDQNILTASASGVTQLNLDRSGNLAIEGSLSDLSTATLTINDALSVSGALSLTGTISDSDSTLVLDDTVDIGSLANGINIATNGVISDNDGNVNINDSTDIAGNIDASGTLTSGNSNAFQVDANGNISSTGTTGITLSGAGAGFTFSGTGNHDITASSGTLRFGAATLTGTVTGNSQAITGLTQLTVDNLELNGNTLSSTASDLILDSFSGTIQLADLTTNGVVYTSGGNGTLNSEAQLNVARGGTGVNASSASNGQLLIGNGSGFSLANITAGSGITISNGAGSIQISQTGSGASKWTQVDGSGILYPNISTLDLLVGGVSTASAKFAFLNNAGGTPVASIAGNLTLDSIGAIQTTKNQTLTIGGDRTGNMILSPRNGSGDVRINGTTTLGGLTYTWPGTQGTNYVLQTNGSGTLSWIDAGTLPTANYWIQGNGILYPKNADVFDLLLGGESTTSAEFAITGINNGTPVATLSAIANSAGLSLTASTGRIQSLNYGTLSLGGDTTGNISISPKNGTGTLALNVGALTINGSTGATSASPTCVSFTNGIVTGSADCGAGQGGSVWTFNTTDGTLYPINNTMDLFFGGVSTNSAKFAFTNIAGGTPTASISANSGNNALSLDGLGNIGTTNKQTLTLGTASTGDINLVIDGSNNLRLNGTPGTTTGGTPTCVTTTNGIVTGTGDCTTPVSSFLWSTSADSGALVQGNTTRDLLIGGVSTESAKFAVLNISNGTPTATLSAGLAGGAYLTASGQLLTTNNQQLTIGGTGTGNIILSPLNGNGTVTSTGTLNLASGKTYQINGTDVLSASTLGANVLTSSLTTVGALNSGSITSGFGSIDIGGDNLTAGGTIAFSGLTTNGFVKTTGGNGTLSVSTTVNLTSDVSGILPIAYGGSPFEQGQGAIFERITTQDFLLGGTSSDSARFAVINIAGGTPTATLSAGLAGGMYMTANGTLSTTNKQTLTLGNSTNTGNIVFANNALFGANASITTTGVGTFTQLAVDNLRLDGNTLDTTSGNLILDSTSGTTRLADLTTDGVVFTSNTDGTLSTEATLSVSRGGTGVNGTTATNGQLLIGHDANNNFSLATLTEGNGITITNGAGSITIAQSAGGTSKWTQNATDGTLYPNISTLDLLVGGTTSSSAKFAVLNLASGTPTASLSGSYLTANGTLSTTNKQTLQLGDFTNTGNINIMSESNNGRIDNYFGLFSPIGFTVNQTVVGERLSITGYGQVGINLLNSTTNPHLAALDLRAPNGLYGGTQPVASISGRTSFAGLVVDNRVGDLFTASSSGLSRFTIHQNGTVSLPNYAGTNALLYAAQTTGQLTAISTGSQNLCLISGASAPSWTSCSAAGSNWEVSSGSIAPKFASVLDLLVGGTASNAAKFAVLNSNGAATPVASLSATTASGGNGLGLALSGDGSIQSLRNGTLTLGGNTTGNLSFLPQNGTGFSTFTGKLGVNTSSLLGTVDLRPNTVNGGTISVASISGRTTFAALNVDNTLGDLFTASSSGLTRFTINQNGTITAPNYAGTNAILYASPTTGLLATATTGSTDLCLISGATTPLWTACPGSGSGASKWTISNATGTIYPINTTLDLLIGGISSDSARFHVFGTTNNNNHPVASVSGNTSQAALITDNRVGDLFTASSSGLTRFVIQNNGNVGIGTSLPSYNLELASTNTSVYTKFNPTTNEDWRIGADGFGLSFINDTDGFTRMTIDENGNVGISATDPTVGSFGRGLEIADSGAGAALALNATSGKKFIIGSLDSPAGLYIQDNTAGVYRMAIDTNGSVGIGTGTSSVLGTLDVRPNTTNGGTLAVASVSGRTSFAGLTVDNSLGDLFTASASGLNKFVIKQNGNIGIGTSTPTDMLNISAPNDGASKGISIERQGASSYLNLGLNQSNFPYINSEGTALVVNYFNGQGVTVGGSSVFGGNDIDFTVFGDTILRPNVDSANTLSIWGSSGTPFNISTRRTDPVASIGASTTFAGFVVDNSGTGDLFTASSSGLNRFTIKQNGNIGIGTTLPSANLHIVQPTTQNALRIDAANSNLVNTIAVYDHTGDTAIAYSSTYRTTSFYGGLGSLNTPAVGIQSNSATGIGISLRVGHLSGSSLYSTAATASISAKTSFATLVVDNDGAGDIFTASSSGLNRFVIKQNGNVGIGTNNPTMPFDVRSSQTTLARFTNTFASGPTAGGGMIGYSDDGAALASGDRLGFFLLGGARDAISSLTQSVGMVGFAAGNWSGTSTPGDLAFEITPSGTTSRSETLRLTSTANFGFNTTSPLATLDVRGSTINGGTISVASISGRTSFAALMVDNTSSNGDIFTASRAGQTKFTIALDRVQIGTGSATGAGGAETPQLLALDSKGSTGDPATGRQGDMYYNTVDEKFRCYQGTGWRDCIAISQSEYLRAERLGSQTSPEIDADDHINFNVATGSGQAIFLDTTSGYVEGGAGAASGRFTLAAGRTYILRSVVPWISGASGNSLNYQWFNITTGKYFGSSGAMHNSSGTNVYDTGYAEATITTTASTVVEVRFVNVGGTLDNIGTSTNGLTSSAFIQAISGAQEVSASEYLYAYQSATNTTNLTTSDHVKFNTNQGSSGTSIRLDTSTTYTNSAGAASLGRFTLQAGKTYKLQGQIARISSGHQANYQWYDATHSTLLGTNGYVSGSNEYLSDARAIFTPTETTLVELRYAIYMDATSVYSTDAFGLPGPTAYIEVISDLTRIAQFTGATSSTDGALGYVPAPVAGQQGSVLLGNGAWTTANYFTVGTDLTSPIATLGARTSYAGLVVDNRLGDLFTASSSGLNRFVIKNNGNVGIGTTLPSNTLSIQTSNQNAIVNLYSVDASVDYGVLQITSAGGAVTAGQERPLALQPNGNTNGTVGIGTGVPLATLDIRGNSGTTPIASVSGRTSFASLVVDNSGAGDLFTASSSGLSRFVIKQNGNVGIGTASNPTSVFQIGFDNQPTLMAVENLSGDALWEGGLSNDLIIRSLANNDAEGIFFQNEVAAGGGSPYDTMAILRTGAVGIGTISPLAGLDIRGNLANNSLAGTQPTASVSGRTSFASLVVDNSGAGDLFTASSSGLNRFVIKQNGNVGINTTNPSSPLDVKTLSGVTESTVASFIAGDDRTMNILQPDNADNADPWTFQTNNAFQFRVDALDVFAIEDGGNVGVRTTGPESVLQVSGGGLCVGSDANCNTDNNTEGVVYSSSTTMTTYDVAENYPTKDTTLVPGEIVTLDKDRGVFVQRSTKPYDNNVLGAISEQPGVLLGGFNGEQFKEEKQVAIALSGRILINVSGEGGLIKVGDYITSSSTPGVGMKATKAGHVLGRALEDYNPANPSAVQKVMVFVTHFYYDPDVYITSTGNISIFEKTGAPSLNPASTYGVNMPDGSEVIRTGVFSDAVIGNLQTGSLDVQSLNLGGTNLNDRLLGLESGFASTSAEFITPFAQLQTQVLSLQDRVASLEASLAFLNSASGSALFTNNFGGFTASSGAELALDSLEVDGNILTDSLNVLGYTTMNELSVTGSIRTGVLTINGQASGGASISTLNGNLKLQDQGFGGIDILDGLVTIDTDGNIETQGTITAKKINIDTTDALSASAGTGTVLSGTSTINIYTTAVTTKSLIQVTFTGNYSPAVRYWIDAKTPGTSFKVKLDQPVANDVKFSWWIVN